MNANSRAVFLSYASEDAEAARRVCDGLRAAGIEVWFDRSELRGGDAWDAQIRRQIRECALFAPIISAHTEARSEGYFRLEWKLAVDRTYLMSEDQAFLLPITVDATSEAHARVPPKFREVQWTHLPGGEPTPDFVLRVSRLLAGAPPVVTAPLTAGGSASPPAAAASPPPAPRARGGWLLATVAVAAVALLAAGGAALYLRHDRRGVAATPAVTAAPPTGFQPPPHSVAVLPFVNMSGDPKQDYFSDGLSEELLNSLATIRELQVAARTSSFSFKGSSAKLGDIGRELNVGAILEGSVRKDGQHLRITAQLINTMTGFHLWSRTYDRDLKNVLSLQTEIATEVTKALEVTLLSDAAALIEEGGTHDAQAFDAYLRGERLKGHLDPDTVRARIAAYDEALRHDPRFAKAYVGKAKAVAEYAGYIAAAGATEPYFAQALSLAEKAIQLAPGVGRAYAVRAIVELSRYEFAAARASIDRALSVGSGDGDVLIEASFVAGAISTPEAALSSAQRAVVLDPLNASAFRALGTVLSSRGRYRDALVSLQRASVLDPALPLVAHQRGLALRGLGELESARRVCADAPRDLFTMQCLAIIDHQQGQVAQATADVAAMREEGGDSAAYQYAEVYAQWGDLPKALEWLEKAYRYRDSGLASVAQDALMDPLRGEPRFQAILRELDFPR